MFNEDRHQEQRRSPDEDIHLTARTLVFVLVVMLVMMLMMMFVLVFMFVLVVMPTATMSVMRMFARMFHNTICDSFSLFCVQSYGNGFATRLQKRLIKKSPPQILRELRG